MIFYTFFAGFNHNQQENGNSYFFEISGFLIVLFLCALERKSEVWLANKYGFEGSVYDSFEGNIILQMYGRETTKKGEYDGKPTFNNFRAKTQKRSHGCHCRGRRRC